MGHNDVIGIQALAVDCIVGILPHERKTPQPLSVTVELRGDFERAAESGSMADAVDYASAATEITFILKAARFPLIESAASALASHLARPPVESARIRIEKPRALGGNGVPSVTMERTPRFDFTGQGPAFANPDAGIFRLKSAEESPMLPFVWSAHEDLPLMSGEILRVYRK